MTGKFADELTLLQLGRQLEEAMPWKGRKPAVHVSTTQPQPAVYMSMNAPSHDKV